MAAVGIKLLFDENFSHKLIEFVANESRLIPANHVRKLKWNGLPDETWMPLAIQSAFVIITADRNEKTRTISVSDFKSLGAKVIYVGSFWDHLGRWDKAKWLVRYWETMVALSVSLNAGEVCSVNRRCARKSL